MTSKILVIRFSSLGDVILASAPILNLKIGFPGSSIFFLTKKRYDSVASRIPGVIKVITVSESPTLMEMFNLVIQLERENLDIVVDLQGNFRSYLVRTLVSAKQKVVYASDRAARIRIVKERQFPAKSPHTIDKYNECLKQLGLLDYSKRPNLLTANSRLLSSDEATVVVAPGASWPNKQWPIEKMAEVASTLHSLGKVKINWAITSQDKHQLDIKDKLGKDNVIELLDCPIDQLADIIQNAHLCLANDSGIAHLASAVGTPVIAIFGPTHPALGFAPRGLFDQLIQVDEYCRPCSLHGNKLCYREERFCFTRISSALVASKATEVISARQKLSGALFVDRDGTVIVDKPFESNPGKIEFESDVFDALLKAQKLGLKIVIVSNQSGVARGYFKFEDAERFNTVLIQLLEKNGVNIAAVYFCPHYPNGTVPEFSRVCNCRKPAPGMAEKAARELNIDLRRSYVVGDKMDDVNLGRIIGAKSYLVMTGQGRDYLETLRKSCDNPEEIICKNLGEAVDRIEKQVNSSKSVSTIDILSKRD